MYNNFTTKTRHGKRNSSYSIQESPYQRQKTANKHGLTFWGRVCQHLCQRSLLPSPSWCGALKSPEQDEEQQRRVPPLKRRGVGLTDPPEEKQSIVWKVRRKVQEISWFDRNLQMIDYLLVLTHYPYLIRQSLKRPIFKDINLRGYPVRCCLCFRI